jgi:hypothetical protein
MMKYLVEIIPESITDIEAAASRLATALKLEPAKALSLLKKNPVTKPVSEAEAEKVARLFTKAGIEVFVRAEDEVGLSSQSTQPVQAQPVQQTQPIQQTQPVPAVTDAQHQNVHAQQHSQPVSEGVKSPSPATPRFEEPSFEEPKFEEPAFEQPSFEEPAFEGSNRTNPGVKAPSLSPETAATGENAFAAKSVQGEETSKIPAGFFTPVPEGSVTADAAGPNPDLPALDDVTPARTGGLGKLAFASIVPGLLALAGVFTALYLLGLPFLRAQQRTSAETAAVSLAGSIGNWIGDVTLDNPAISQQVQNVILGTQTELRGRGIDLVLLTDNEGNQLSGWFKDGQGLPEGVSADAVRTASTTPEARLQVDDDTLELVATPIQRGGTSLGNVIVGSTEQSLMANVQPLLTTLLLAGVLPLLLGILLSLLIGRNR